MVNSGISQISFHECSVDALSLSNGRFSLKISDVKKGNEVCSIVISASSCALIIDGVTINCFTPPQADGEILSLKFTDNKVDCLNEWHFFPGSKTLTQEFIIISNHIIWKWL